MNDIICQIKWTKQDFIDAFLAKTNRFPTDNELEKCIKFFPAKQMQDSCIEYSWDFIFSSIDNCISDGESK